MEETKLPGEAVSEMTVPEGKKPTFAEYVTMTVESGVAPLELRFYPIVAPDSGLPVAYRTATRIRSVVLGVMEEKEYTYVSDKRTIGEEVLKHNLQHAIAALKEFANAGRNVRYLSVRCPAELPGRTELYRVISGVLNKNPNLDPSKLCLEFPASVMEQDTAKTGEAMKDMKLLKVRTAIVGCGAENFPMAKLLTVTPDIVVLDGFSTGWAGSRDKPQLMTSLISYVISMGIECVAEGTEEIRRALRRSDCVGFIDREAESLSLAEAIAQKENED